MNSHRASGEPLIITWEEHRRTRGLSTGLNMALFELSFRGGRLSRYLNLALKTYETLKRARPRVLLVQNPSLVLTLWAWILRPLFGYKLIVDAHNEAVRPFIHSRWPIPALARFLLSKADLTIVTNNRLAALVERAGGRAFVLPDPLPDLPLAAPAPAQPLGSCMEIMVVCTYAPDEPIGAIFDAAAALGHEFCFHVTGNSSKLSSEMRAKVPSNVHLTGFLPEADYWLLMQKCHVVLDLTLMPDCLVCGAYEALAMCRPMILSDNSATRELFGDVSVLSVGTSEDILRAVREMRVRYDDLRLATAQHNVVFRENWSRAAYRLSEALGS